MQFDVVANVTVTIVAHPSLLGSAVCFSDVEEQGVCVVDDKIEASTIAPIGFLTK